jgi:hypothetical protein
MIPIGREKKNDIPRARKNAHQSKGDQVSMRSRKSNKIVGGVQLESDREQTRSIRSGLYEDVQARRKFVESNVTRERNNLTQVGWECKDGD